MVRKNWKGGSVSDQPFLLFKKFKKSNSYILYVFMVKDYGKKIMVIMRLET